MRNILKITAVLLILVLLALFQNWQQKKNAEPKTAGRYFTLLSEVADLVRSDYVEDVSPDGKFPAAFDFLFHSLDPQSAYLDAQQTRVYRRILQATAFLPGIFGQLEGYQFRITHVQKGSPADRALLQCGDIIEEVDGKPFPSPSFWHAYLALASDRPQSLMLTVKKKETENRMPVSVQLENAGPVSAVKDFGEGCLLVHLGRSQAQTVSEVGQKIKPDRPHTLIIDLTRTECGDLESWLSLTRIFFPSDQTTVTLQTRHQSQPLAIGSPSHLSYRAVVIIDGSTKMFGELLAALFQKNGYTLIGKSTAGVSAKVDQFPLEDGSSALLTTGYFFFNGKNMLLHRIIPDKEVTDDQFPRIYSLAKKMLLKTG